MSSLLEVLTTEDLHDFVDGRSEGPIAEAMLDLMSEDPAISRLLCDYRRQARSMREAFAVETDDRTARLLAGLLLSACGVRESRRSSAAARG